MKITNWFIAFLIFLIRGLRPLLGPAACTYEVSCGDYAIIQLQEQSFIKAQWLIVKRLLSCIQFK